MKQKVQPALILRLTADTIHMNGNLSLSVAVMLLMAVLSLVVDIVGILMLYDVITSLKILSYPIGDILKVVVLLWIGKHFDIPELIKPTLILLLIVLLNESNAKALIQWVFRNDIPQMLSFFTVAVIITCLVSLMWIVVGSHLLLNKKAQSALNGYAPVLGSAAVIISVFEIIVFLQMPKLIGQLCMSIGLICLFLSLPFNQLTLSYRKRSLFFNITVGIPTAIYIAPVAMAAVVLITDVAISIYNDTELREATGEQAGPVDTINNWQSLLNESLAGYQQQSSLSLFNDTWLHSDGSQVAVNSDGVFTRNSDEQFWTPLYQPGEELVAEGITFDQTGTKGVVGLGDGHVAITKDGGDNWHQPDLFAVFEQLTGRQYGDKYTDDYSTVYLNPESGTGSFTMGCNYFSTDNFAQDWKMTRVTVTDRKNTCLKHTPFSLDHEAGLAITSGLTGSEILITRSDDGLSWAQHCVVDHSDFNFTELPRCEDTGILSASQKTFLDRFAKQTTPHTAESEFIDKIIAAESISSSVFNGDIRNNGQQQWITGRGFFVSMRENDQYEVDHRIPALTQILPYDGQHALGTANYLLYETHNAGRTWQQLHGGMDDIHILVQATKSADVFYVIENTLYRWSGNQRAMPLFDGDEYQYFGEFTASPTGQKLLFVDDSHYWFSSDSGLTWAKHKIPGTTGPIDEYGNTGSVTVYAFDCLLDTTGSECIALLENSKLLSWAPGRPLAYSEIPGPKFSNEGVSSSTLSLFSGTPRYHLLPGNDTSQLWVFENNEWTLIRLPRKYDYHSNLHYTPDRKRAHYETDEAELLLIDSSGEHQVFSVPDELKQGAICTTETGDVTLINNLDQLAISTDKGKTWLTNKQGAYVTACGLHDDWLWILGQDLSIHRRNPDTIEPGDTSATLR